jgi:hypothetical protein
MYHKATNRIMSGLKETLFWLGTAILIIGIVVSSYGLALYVLAWSHVPDPELYSPDPEEAIFGRSLQSLGVGVFLTGTIIALFTKPRGSAVSRLLTLAIAAALPYEMVAFFMVRTRGIPLVLIFVITAMWASIWLLYVALTKTKGAISTNR